MNMNTHGTSYPILEVSPAITAAFVAIVALVVAQLVAAVFVSARRLGRSAAESRRQAARVALGLALWLAALFVLGASGVLGRFDLRPPPMAAMFAAVLVASVVVARSSLGGQLARGLPLWALFALQAFRLPLEMVLHALYDEGALPVQMTWSGLNFDVVTGLTATVLAVVAWRRPVSARVLLAWNVLGLGLVVAITVIAALAAPLPTRVFFDGVANTIVTQAPWTWLPGLLVVAAYVGHFVVFRRLAAERAGQLQEPTQHFSQSQVGPTRP